MKNLLILTVFLFMFACATNISQEKLTDSELIDASKNEDILIKEGVIKDPSFIADKYPISGEIEVLNDQIKYLPLDQNNYFLQHLQVKLDFINLEKSVGFI